MTATDSTALAKKAKLSAYYKAWRAANKEKLQAYAAEYYKTNKERMNRTAAERYRADPEPYKARATQWSNGNKDRRREILNKWRAEHPASCAKWRRGDYERRTEYWLARGKEFRAKNPEIIRAIKIAWHANNPEAQAHHVGLRRSRKMQATPTWADLVAIKAIYKQAALLRKQTGIAWHVDHEIPLKHPLVCGLHNEFNLRVIPARENQSKSNKLINDGAP